MGSIPKSDLSTQTMNTRTTKNIVAFDWRTWWERASPRTKRNIDLWNTNATKIIAWKERWKIRLWAWEFPALPITKRSMLLKEPRIIHTYVYMASGARSCVVTSFLQQEASEEVNLDAEQSNRLLVLMSHAERCNGNHRFPRHAQVYTSYIILHAAPRQP